MCLWLRLNRDTLYSTAVFDLDAGPVTITLPDAGKRFMTLMTIDQDHYVVEVVYDSKPHTYMRDKRRLPLRDGDLTWASGLSIPASSSRAARIGKTRFSPH